ncbi:MULTISPECIES: hypothetical protein [Catenuloplanes]|uniref:Uncharacterized protein n=1 Tax=Catenuloplanes niger TaxID=587534 RepID=A0AAE4CQP6_9ACTN|nr:hypothetical protein [Catenuloplanes niger]MDR7320727.1 hypothetical protein [Catenuloplanes niger]
MTLATKGSRHIVIEGAPYRWRVRRRPTYVQGMGWSPLTVAVEAADISGSLLLVKLPYAHPGNWMNLPGGPVTPAIVKAGVLLGLADGWKPRQPGRPHALVLDHPPR